MAGQGAPQGTAQGAEPQGEAAPAVTRFAPSPTGWLHPGVARTALFNFLAARRSGGRFLLRFEDSDAERSEQHFEDAICEALGWLGMDWDGRSRLSDHGEGHRQLCAQLAEGGHAYWCECTPQDLQLMRKQQRAARKPPGYDGRCRDKGLQAGPGRVLRLRTPDEGETRFADGIRGEVATPNAQLRDPVLMRSDGSCTYQLCAVYEDHHGGITLVARGEDLLASTPLQLLLYRAMGWQPPGFAHLPLVNGTDGRPLSKRHGAEGVLQLREQGYLPQAVVNQLARLGWSHGDQEVFAMDELVRHFAMSAVGRAAATYDPKHLDWLNREHIRRAPEGWVEGQLRGRFGLDEALAGAGLGDDDGGDVAAAIPLARGATLAQIAQDVVRMLVPPADYGGKPAAEAFAAEALQTLAAARAMLAEQDFPWGRPEDMEQRVRALLEQLGLGYAKLGKPLRLALVGSTDAAGITELLQLLGRERTLQRLAAVLPDAEGKEA